MASPFPGEGRITRERYWRLVEEGVIAPDDRVELLDGVIVSMSPQNPTHAFVISVLTRFLDTIVGPKALVRGQTPLDLSDESVPEPDLAVVPGTASEYLDSHPTRALLVIEVAGRSLAADRLTKARIYANGAVDEYWIVNLRDRCVEVHRSPVQAERRFADVRVVRSGETLDLVAFPGVTLAVDDLLPPAPSR